MMFTFKAMISEMCFFNPSISPPPMEVESVEGQKLGSQHISGIFYTTSIVEEQVGETKNQQSIKMGDCLMVFTLMPK